MTVRMNQTMPAERASLVAKTVFRPAVAGLQEETS